MMDFKKIGKKLIFVPVWLMVVMVAFSAAALVAVFLNGWQETVVAYIVYAFSAYTTGVVSVFCVRTVPGLYRRTKEKIYCHPIGNRYMTDAVFKVRVSLYISLGINVLYSVFKLISGILYSSYWWGSIAVYYILLSVMRFALLRYMRTNDLRADMLSELRRYRLCGILMLVLNLALSVMVTIMVINNRSYSYPGVMIFAAAAYTFYTVTISIVDLVRYRKYRSPVMSASKAIRFAAALVSLLSLETAMLAQFGEDARTNLMLTCATGAGVCAAVLAVSVYMIVSSNRKIRGIKASARH